MQTTSTDNIATVRQHLAAFQQEHLLQFASELEKAQLQALLEQIAKIDFEKLAALHEQSKVPAIKLRPEAITPIEVLGLPKSAEDHQRDERAYEAGLEALRQGRVAAILVAGGQGSRLGFEHPKGMFPIGPVQGTSLFQIHAEKILYWSLKSGRPIPWFIMTSPDNRTETETFFRENNYFGLEGEHVYFFEQGTMPAVDAQTGKVLLSEKGKVFTSPNGHGGTLKAMRDCGVLDKMKEYGADIVYYFQVDNAHLKILDPVFLGHHVLTKAELTTKVIRKEHAKEKVGLIVQYEGKPTTIEYSDLPEEVGSKVDANGELLFWAGSIAIHAFDRAFLERLTATDLGLPFHFANKKVPYIDPLGQLVEPEAANAIKFEMFIFDAMPQAQTVTVVETDRAEEYEPVKNASGEHSPEVVREAMVRRAAQWLEHAGVEVPRDESGKPKYPLEISPLAGVTAEEFSERLLRRDPIAGPTYYSIGDVRNISE